MVPRVHVANEALPEEGWRHKPADADLNHELRSTRSWHVGERSGLVARGREEWLAGTWERGVAESPSSSTGAAYEITTAVVPPSMPKRASMFGKRTAETREAPTSETERSVWCASIGEVPPSPAATREQRGSQRGSSAGAGVLTATSGKGEAGREVSRGRCCVAGGGA